MGEKRLYSFVPYQLIGIQKGIQTAHAIVEFQQTYGNDEDFLDWQKNWKTIIILNGGTTNEGNSSVYGLEKAYGGIQQIMSTIEDFGFHVEGFWEPDLNNTLTSFVFIVDEVVFNFEKYPPFEKFLKEKVGSEKTPPEIYESVYNDWLRTLDSDKNQAQNIEKIRIFLKKFKLA